MNDTPATPALAATARTEQMFPKLTAAQVERIASHGHRRSTNRGEVLYDVGTFPLPWLVIVQGEVELVHPADKGDTLIQILGARPVHG